MKFSLSSELPLWLTIFCFAFGIAVAGIIYYRNHKEGEIGNRLRWILFALRSLAIFIITFLLISPFILSFDPIVEKPIIIFGEDHSRSVALLTDSARMQHYIQQRKEILNTYGESFEFHNFSFGEEIHNGHEGSYTERLTDISGFLREMEDRYENRNVAMLMLSSDGLYNKGENPFYMPSDFPYPIYSIALGDTVERKDAAIAKVHNNKLAFLGNKFEVEIVVRSTLLRGVQSTLQVRSNGKVYHSQPVAIDRDAYQQKIRLSLPAELVGLQRFEVEILPISGEVSLTNNKHYFYVDVIEDQQKILILASAPHPDIKALTSAINGSKNYRASAEIVGNFKGKIEDYNLVVLHQVPSGSQGMPPFMQGNKVPVLYVLGKNSSISIFNQLSSGLKLDGFRGTYTDATPIMDPTFKYFATDDEFVKSLPQFPPLICPIATYGFQGDFRPFILQKIGNVATPYSLIGFYEQEGRKSGVVSGEGLWKWRLYDYKVNGSSERFDEMIRKCVQFLAVREDRSRFRVSTEPSWFEHENVIFDAEYYDKSYEQNTEQQIALKITNEARKIFEYQFLPINDGYRADIGKLSEGEYTWIATLNDGIDLFKKSGKFTVKPLQLEEADQRANHQLLYNLSEKHGGKMIYADRLKEDLDVLLSEGKYNPVLHYRERMKALISFKWLFFILLALLGTEWAVRKWIGLR